VQQLFQTKQIIADRLRQNTQHKPSHTHARAQLQLNSSLLLFPRLPRIHSIKIAKKECQESCTKQEVVGDLLESVEGGGKLNHSCCEEMYKN
jgi:hypothetical protein